VDRKKVPANLPQIMDGLRTHYVVMDRMHVTRSYASPIESRSRCMPQSIEMPAFPTGGSGFDPSKLLEPLGLNLN
jgi:hypothetical protein